MIGWNNRKQFRGDTQETKECSLTEQRGGCRVGTSGGHKRGAGRDPIVKFTTSLHPRQTWERSHLPFGNGVSRSQIQSQQDVIRIHVLRKHCDDGHGHKSQTCQKESGCRRYRMLKGRGL